MNDRRILEAVYLRGGMLLSVIHYDNNVWIGDMSLNKKESLQSDQIGKYAKNYLYPY